MEYDIPLQLAHLVYGQLVEDTVAGGDTGAGWEVGVGLTVDVLDSSPLVGHQSRVAVVEPGDELDPGQPGGNAPKTLILRLEFR